MGCDQGMRAQRAEGQKEKKERRESLGNEKKECEKGLLGSGVEYSGACLNGVREVIGVLWYLARRG